jgi:aspartyl-tRNA(Asn)/glutamyl-tRNA(Gln) amidotransferase subunit A
VPAYFGELNADIKGMKIGVPKEYFVDGMQPEVRARVEEAIEVLKSKGAEIVEVSLPNTKYGSLVYAIVCPSEVSSNLARYDGVRYGSYEPGETLFADYAKTRGENFGAEVRRRIMLGTYVLSSGYYDAYYGKAVAVRRLITQDFINAFKAVDVIAMPTTPDVAFPIGSKTADPLQMYLEDIFTVPANIAGVPALSIPSGHNDQGLPFGLQLIAPHFREDRLFAVGKTFEHAVA